MLFRAFLFIVTSIFLFFIQFEIKFFISRRWHSLRRNIAITQRQKKLYRPGIEPGFSHASGKNFTVEPPIYSLFFYNIMYYNCLQSMSLSNHQLTSISLRHVNVQRTQSQLTAWYISMVITYLMEVAPNFSTFLFGAFSMMASSPLQFL